MPNMVSSNVLIRFGPDSDGSTCIAQVASTAGAMRYRRPGIQVSGPATGFSIRCDLWINDSSETGSKDLLIIRLETGKRLLVLSVPPSAAGKVSANDNET